MTILRAGICTLIAFAVLAHGAVEAWSLGVLQIGAALLLVSWGVLQVRQGRFDLVGNVLFLPLLAIGLLAALQLVIGESVYPYLTKTELLRLAACFIVFFLFIQCYHTPDQLRRFAWFLLTLGFAVAVFGMIQFFTFNQKLYWMRDLPPGGNPFGPYVNRNHFAGMMELVLPLGLALLVLRPIRRDQIPLVALFTIVPLGALFLSASRGGITSFIFQLCLLGLLVWRQHAAGRSERIGVVGLLLLLPVIALFVFWLNIGHTVARFSETQMVELSGERRAPMVQDTWRIFLDHPVLGTGLGTLVAVYPKYESMYDGKIVDHAHNDYVELLAEAGVPGGLAGTAFVVLLFWSSLRTQNTDRLAIVSALRLGAMVSCAGLLLHGLVDFNLHITANLLIFLLLAGVATIRVPRPAPAPRA